MKLKTICLLLPCVTLFSSCANQNRKNVDKQEDSIKVNTAISDTAIIEEEAIDMIKSFYMDYTTAFLTSDHSRESIKKKYLTQRLIEKVDRMTASTDGDPIIRAQDLGEDDNKTLNVKHLENNWYMVNFTLGKGSQFEQRANIPLKVTRTEGQYMIDYITPAWNDSIYGDNLLCDNPALPKIDAKTPLSFLKTFYDLYTMKYGSMPEDLTTQLAALRAEYLTPSALTQFENAVNESKLDGHKGYDILIDDFDFDCLWRSSIKVTQLDDNTYQMCYTRENTPFTIQIKVAQKGQKYQIDGIKVLQETAKE